MEGIVAMKTILYEQVSRIGKAISSPKRLEILELLVQGEKTVEKLADLSRIDVKLASAHLRPLREARLVEARRDGKYIHYRLSNNDVADLLVKVREVAEEHLLELRVALGQMSGDPGLLSSETRESLLAKARTGDVIVIDVRPCDEYAAAHLPFARSIPLAELQQRIDELPPGKPVVAYCRGPYCVMSDAAVELLRSKGFSAHKISDGVGEWRATGLLLEY
jgi:DNA-binding transcriptional ArsR family regulator/rhodanese-related sulfurtransferase